MENKDKLFRSLFGYLRKSNLSVDKTGLSNELKSHPKYPQIISVVDTLELFNISHGLYNASIEEIAPEFNMFMALLRDERKTVSLSLIERQNIDYKVDSINTPLDVIKKNWEGIVLILDKNEQIKTKSFLKRKALKVFSMMIIGLLLLISSSYNLIIMVFYLLSLLGIYFSTIALQDIFEIESRLFNKVCVKSECDSVIESTKWKLFRVISFSDLSIAFFISQLLLLFFMVLSGDTQQFLLFQKGMLYLCIPVILASVYYQKKIERRWCPICLSIIGVLTLEIIFISLTIESYYLFDWRSMLFFLSIYGLIFFFWVDYKKMMTEQKTVNASYLQYNRFLNDYSVFKKLLTKDDRYRWKEDVAPLTEKTKKLNLTLVTDPFCDHCEDLHNKLKHLLVNFKNQFYLNVIFNIEIEEESNEDQLLYRNIINLQNRENNNIFIETLDDWYENKDTKKWLERYGIRLDQSEIDAILSKQNIWCIQNHINYTPALFINGFLLPSIYRIEKLRYFIEELINDSDF